MALQRVEHDWGTQLRGGCQLSVTLSSLSSDGCVCVPTLLIVWPEASQNRAWGLLGWTRSQCHYGGLPGELSQQIFPGASATGVLSPTPPPHWVSVHAGLYPRYMEMCKGDSSCKLLELWRQWAASIAHMSPGQQGQWLVPISMSFRGGSPHTSRAARAATKSWF